MTRHLSRPPARRVRVTPAEVAALNAWAAGLRHLLPPRFRRVRVERLALP